jgi:hypothetical protein
MTIPELIYAFEKAARNDALSSAPMHWTSLYDARAALERAIQDVQRVAFEKGERRARERALENGNAERFAAQVDRLINMTVDYCCAKVRDADKQKLDAAWGVVKDARGDLIGLLVALREEAGEVPVCPNGDAACDSDRPCPDCAGDRQDRADEARETSRERALDANDCNQRGRE